MIKRPVFRGNRLKIQCIPRYFQFLIVYSFLRKVAYPQQYMSVTVGPYCLTPPPPLANNPRLLDEDWFSVVNQSTVSMAEVINYNL